MKNNRLCYNARSAKRKQGLLRLRLSAMALVCAMTANSAYAAYAWVMGSFRYGPSAVEFVEKPSIKALGAVNVPTKAAPYTRRVLAGCFATREEALRERARFVRAAEASGRGRYARTIWLLKTDLACAPKEHLLAQNSRAKVRIAGQRASQAPASTASSVALGADVQARPLPSTPVEVQSDHKPDTSRLKLSYYTRDVDSPVVTIMGTESQASDYVANRDAETLSQTHPPQVSADAPVPQLDMSPWQDSQTFEPKRWKYKHGRKVAYTDGTHPARFFRSGAESDGSCYQIRRVAVKDVDNVIPPRLKRLYFTRDASGRMCKVAYVMYEAQADQVDHAY